MTSNALRVALVSGDGAHRTTTAAYLRNAGFDVHECGELAVPSAFVALVLLGAEAASGVIQVRSWMRVTRSQRVIVVTSKPAAFRELLAIHSTRLCVLAAPVFGWELVDALRETRASGPRGA